MAANESFLEFEDFDSSTISAFVKLQAAIRGVLLRRVLHEIRQEYEAIVTDIEGGLDVDWPQNLGTPVVRKRVRSLRATEQEVKKQRANVQLSRKSKSSLPVEETDTNTSPKKCDQTITDALKQTQRDLIVPKDESFFSKNKDTTISVDSENDIDNDRNRTNSIGAESEHSEIVLESEQNYKSSNGIKATELVSVSNQCVQTDMESNNFSEVERDTTIDLVSKEIQTGSPALNVGNGSEATKLFLYDDDSSTSKGNMNGKEEKNKGVSPLLQDVGTDLDKFMMDESKPINSEHKIKSHNELNYLKDNEIDVKHPSDLIHKHAEISNENSGGFHNAVDVAVSPIKFPSPSFDTHQDIQTPTSANISRDNISDRELPEVQKSPESTQTENKTNSAKSLLLEFDQIPQMESITQELPDDKDSLLELKKTLSMELLWIQQAINSRKHYLKLKHQIS